ncbi:MAG: CehA/McbA family metallohydrolase [Candidatus Undinarchaeales archaeon]|jgi:hypothetical protein|nr:CehA/McbA family metallohydrolase [Candidatus Undinarchaeales archaeon]MDP7493729.1 CehA/McbA family metallohydrolase [Candidatus Undinarchaeales archaeon]
MLDLEELSLHQEIASLRAQGKSVYDLHSHTQYSDGLRSPETMVRTAYELGLSGIAITDHDSTDSYERACAEAAKYDDFMIIPASEVSSGAGHVLAYGIREELPAGLPLTETTERIHAQGGVAVAAHPYSANLGTQDPFDLDNIEEAELALLDGIEVYNSSVLFPGNANELASALADKYQLARLGGSDAHYAWSLGTGLTVMPETHTVDGFLQNIRDRKSEGHKPAVNDRFGTKVHRYLDYFVGGIPRAFMFIANQIRERYLDPPQGEVLPEE